MDTEIEEVKQEIRKVEEQIVHVEGKLTQVVTEVDVAYWRKKEEQLRKKEEQLRKKEEQLREEKLRKEEHLRKKEELMWEKDRQLFKAETSGPDMTAELLAKLIQRFDSIPESLDAVQLGQLLKTDLLIKIPCFSYALASNFSDCLEHSAVESCPRLESVLASFLSGPGRAMGSSENALISLWDRLVVDLPRLIYEDLRYPFDTKRNVVDESLSTFQDRRDYLLYLDTLPVVFGEEKRMDNDMLEARKNLITEHQRLAETPIYGRLGYVMCYAAAGQSRFQFFAVRVGIANPSELIPLTGVIDPSLRKGRVELLKTFVNVIRWMHTVHELGLTRGILNLYVPVMRPSPHKIGEVKITLFRNYVKNRLRFQQRTWKLYCMCTRYYVQRKLPVLFSWKG